MRILFWNMRGFGALGRRKQLRELKHKYKIELICLQETIKADFSPGELASISEGENLDCCIVPFWKDPDGGKNKQYCSDQ
jgi:hypothetical protein